MEPFSKQHLQQAWRMHDLGLRPPRRPGIYVSLREGAGAAVPTPLQEGIHLVVWAEEFIGRIGGEEVWENDAAWLPTWEQGRAWLTARSVPIKHIYYVVKEGVMFYGEDERYLLYEEITRILTIDGAG
jgi:hypothetical protein